MIIILSKQTHSLKCTLTDIVKEWVMESYFYLQLKFKTYFWYFINIILTQTIILSILFIDRALTLTSLLTFLAKIKNVAKFWERVVKVEDSFNPYCWGK